MECTGGISGISWNRIDQSKLLCMRGRNALPSREERGVPSPICDKSDRVVKHDLTLKRLYHFVTPSPSDPVVKSDVGYKDCVKYAHLIISMSGMFSSFAIKI